MKISELEDSDKIITKEYLDEKIANFETRLETRFARFELGIADRIIASERGQRMWIWGLYALVIVSYFVRH